uniref:Transmembrane protein n=1 Tax=Plectus sambesii TaxID=2011161 RepID=A0A914UY86_9BILA
MEDVQGDNNGDDEIYFSATEEELPSRPWTEDDEMSMARASSSSSSGSRQASSASLLSTASLPTAAQHAGRLRRRLKFALLLSHLAWFDALAALCVEALFFVLLEHPLAIDITVLSLSAVRSFGSLTLAAAFVDGRHSARKYTFLLILSALLLALSVFLSCQTVSVLIPIPASAWLSSFSGRLHLCRCALDLLGTLLSLLTTAMTIALLHESGYASISTHLISQKRSGSRSSDTSSHYIEL